MSNKEALVAKLGSEEAYKAYMSELGRKGAKSRKTHSGGWKSSEVQSKIARKRWDKKSG